MKCGIHGYEMVIKKKGVGWEMSIFGCPECEAEEEARNKDSGREKVVFSSGNGWGRY